MKNANIDEAWKYHNGTKHPGMPQHYFDWKNYPFPFKIYKDLAPIKIPEDVAEAKVSALSAISNTVGANADETKAPDIAVLGKLLFLCAGITKKATYTGGGDIYFRAAPCTGALYHIELYVVCGDIGGLDAGVYHFAPHDFSLRRLREGDHRTVLIQAAGGNNAVTHAPVSLVSTTAYWRNAWKYQARAYRHAFWDGGTILANLLAASNAYGISSEIVLGFEDSKINSLLGLDTKRETAISLVALGQLPETVSSEPLDPKDISFQTQPYSDKEVDYPSIRAMHNSSCLESADEVREWRSVRHTRSDTKSEPQAGGALRTLTTSEGDELEWNSLEHTVIKRGSTRTFERTSITMNELSDVIVNSTSNISFDFLQESDPPLNDLYLIVNDVEGLDQGAYFYHRENKSLELIHNGDFREQAGHLGLDQGIPADASVDLFFLADLGRILDEYGNRGYRAAQLEAGILGGRVYLCAYGQGLGASGLTFYDDDVTDFFSPHAEGKSPMFLVALGKSAKRAK